ncbi:MAG TPA: hypothetical protein PK358_12330 [Spirochaetota bacterium]|nr:hypothetical protein [Spirochaetota bacterium]
MKFKLIITAFCCIIITGLISLYINSSGDAEWLQVETPSCVSYKKPFSIRVTLFNPEPGMIIGADIHGSDKAGVSRGFLSGVKNQKVTCGKAVYEFSINVPEYLSVEYVFPVIVLSEDGTWEKRVSAAEGEPVPVIKTMDEITSLHLKKMKLKNTAEGKVRAMPESAELSILISIIWFAVSVITVIYKTGGRAYLFPAASIVSAVWELSGCSDALAAAFRYTALKHGLYISRHAPQQYFSIIIIFLFIAVLLYLLLFAKRNCGLVLLLCFSIFWSVAFLRVLSLHQIDRLFSFTVSEIPMGQAIRLAASSVCLAAVIIIFLRERRRAVSVPGNN